MRQFRHTIRLFILLQLLFFSILSAQQITVVGGDKPAYELPDTDPLLHGVYVIYSTLNSSITYQSASTSPIEWYSYGAAGAADESLLQRVGTGTTLTALQGDCGYAIKQDGRFTYLWVVNYQTSPFRATALVEGDLVTSQATCQQTFVVMGAAAPLTYYTPLPNRGEQEVAREVILSWNTLSWNDEAHAFVDAAPSETLPFTGEITVEAPYVDTPVTLEGDQFLRYWNLSPHVVSCNYTAVAIAAKAEATQLNRDNDNEWDDVPEEGLGGSAPVEVEFRAYYNGAIHLDWQFSRDEAFDIIDQHYYNNDQFTYTFSEEGTTYVRLVATVQNLADEADAIPPCYQYISDTYTISVGDSRLEAPNFFTPGTTPGENDEWKVAYKSITSYKCTIVNRWGVLLFESTNPAEGWSGMQGGRVVPPGVYFYVIEARGADQKQYLLKGDINILRAKN